MTAADRIVANTYFTNSPVHTAMLHTEGKYHFDFGTFHNADDLVDEEGARFRRLVEEPDLLPGGQGRNDA